MGRRYELIVCPLLLDELQDVPSRDRFLRFITPDERNVLMALLRSDATTVADPDIIEPVTPNSTMTTSSPSPVAKLSTPSSQATAISPAWRTQTPQS